VVWVRVSSLPANATTRLFVFTGNNAAAVMSSPIATFDADTPAANGSGGNSATAQVSGANTGGVINSQRGFRFSPNEDVLLLQVGKNEPNGSTRYITLFDFATQAILLQTQVSGPAAQYSYADVAPIWLTQGTQYLLELYQGATDGYYFGASPQIDPHLTFYDMRYCNSCTKDTFPTNSLGGMHYGYSDFTFVYRKHATPEPGAGALGTPLGVTPASLPGGAVGTAYSQSFGTSGGVAPLTFTLASGSLPAGLTLAADGTLGGTPTAGGNFLFTVGVSDSVGATGTATYTLTVAAPTITLAPASLPAAQAGAAYGQSITASGGTSPHAYALTGGALPAGLTLGGGGNLSGTPTAVGSFNFTVTATDSSTGTGPYTGSTSYSLTVDAPALLLSPAAGTLNAGYNAAFSQSFAGSGGTGPYSYVLAGSLPSGINWNAGTGTLSGTSTQSGNFPITVTATDSTTGTGAPFSVAQNYTLVVATPGAPSVSNASVGVAYNAGAATPTNVDLAAHVSGVYTSLAVATPPAHGSVGAFAGAVVPYTPTAGFHGTDSFTFTATGPGGSSAAATVTVTVASPTLSLAPAALPAGTQAAPYSQAITASGGFAPYGYAVTAGTLPPGLTLSAAGMLSGTPTASGSFAFTVTATDSSTGNGSVTASQAYNLSVAAPGSVILALSGGSGQQALPGSAFAQPLRVTLTDSVGTPLAGYTINFAAPVNGASAALSAASAITDASGSAQVTATANATPGGYVVTASVVGFGNSVGFNLTNIANAATTIPVPTLGITGSILLILLLGCAALVARRRIA